MLRRILVTAAAGALVLSGAAVPQAEAAGRDPNPGCNIHSGSSGACVSQWQQVLKSYNLYSGPIDGSFGAGTVAATKAFQGNVLHVAADGSVGPKTNAALCGLPGVKGYVDQLYYIVSRPHSNVWEVRLGKIESYCWA